MTEPEGALSAYVRGLIRHRRLVAFAFLVFTLVAGYRTVKTYAGLRSDLEELLPETAPSVMALSTLRQRLPSVRHLGVVVALERSEDLPAANRFLDALAERIRSYPKDMVRSVRVDAKAERVFAETYALQLMDPEDVQRLREAVERRRDWDVSRRMGLDLEDEADDPRPTLPIAELRAKYEARFGKPRLGAGDRFVAPDGKSAVLLVQSAGQGTGYHADQILLARVAADVQSLGFPGAFAQSLRLGYAGDVAVRVEEGKGLESDLTFSGVVVLLLVIGGLVWFYRSARAIPILGLPLMTGTLGAFGLVALPPLSILYLNSNTAFLGSIVVGNGINSGIILLARFAEERRAGAPIATAVDVSVRETWKATLAAACAAAAAYGSLVFTNFRGFNQFGWIGGIGLVVCWAAMYGLVPILAFWFGGSLGTRPQRERADSRPIGQRLTEFVLSAPRSVLFVTALLTLLAGFGVARRAGDWIEYDLSKLRRRDSWEHGERYWGRRMDAALGRYLTPTLALAESPEEARAIETRVAAVQARHGAGDLIASVRSASTFVSPDRLRSLDESRRLAEVLTPRMKQDLLPRDRELVEKALSGQALTPLSLDQVPDSLLLGLKEFDGRSDRNVLIFPKLSLDTWNAAKLDGFATDLRRAASVGAKARPVAGSLLLSSDIARAMKADGPRATLLSLFAVLGICWIAFRGSRRPGAGSAHALGYSLAAMASLFLGVLLMLGLLAVTGERLNFSNFVALPITFGIAADYSINVLRRYQSDEHGSLGAALSSTSGAVAMCSATTVIGFGSLIMAQNRALFSFGMCAISGEITCLATAVLVLPAALVLWERRATAARRSACTPVPPRSTAGRPRPPSSAADSSEV